MRIIKQVLRQQTGVVLLETKLIGGQPDTPARVSYAITSKRTPKIHCFDEFQAAQSYFDDEASYCRQTLHSQDRRYAQTIEIGPDSYLEKRA
jgi:hypothetical protein